MCDVLYKNTKKEGNQTNIKKRPPSFVVDTVRLIFFVFKHIYQ